MSNKYFFIIGLLIILLFNCKNSPGLELPEELNLNGKWNIEFKNNTSYKYITVYLKDNYIYTDYKNTYLGANDTTYCGHYNLFTDLTIAIAITLNNTVTTIGIDSNQYSSLAIYGTYKFQRADLISLEVLYFEGNCNCKKD